MLVQTAVTIFNRRLGSGRREVYFPSCISGASYFEGKGSEHSSGVRTERLSYKLRIPKSAEVQDGRGYIGENTYRTLPEEEAEKHWTLQKGDIILARETCLTEPLDEAAVRRLAASLAADIITVKEYADNTSRGTDAVRHWRIGGE